MDPVDWTPRLPPRILALQQMVLPERPAADIGAGDGQLTRLLLSRGAPRVVATEVRQGPYERLRTRLEGVPGADVRFGWGLRPLEVREADTIVIAGMGAHTIVTILEDAGEKARGARRLVLQSMGRAHALRRFLLKNGFAWSGEDVVKDGERFYEVLLVDRTLPTLQWDPSKAPLGPVLSGGHDPAFRAFRKWTADATRDRMRKKRLGGASARAEEELLVWLKEGSPE